MCMSDEEQGGLAGLVSESAETMSIAQQMHDLVVKRRETSRRAVKIIAMRTEEEPPPMLMMAAVKT